MSRFTPRLAIVTPARASNSRYALTNITATKYSHQRNVPPYLVTRLVQEQQRKKARHASVPISERVDAQEIEHVRRNEQQRFDRACVQRRSICIVEPRHGIGRQMRGQGLEEHDGRPVRSGFGNVDVCGLPPAAATRNELKEITMQLQHDVRGQRHVCIVGVDGVQNLARASNLLLRAVRRLGAISHEVSNALPRRDNAFNPVRGLRALNERVLGEGLEYLGGLLLEQSLLAAVFADQPDALNQPPG